MPSAASYILVGSETQSIRQFWALYRHFQVTSGQMTTFRATSTHLRSRDVISCHVTASCYELQPCRKSNAQHAPVFGVLQPLAGDFRSNDATSGTLPVSWGNVMSFLVKWLHPRASYSPVGSQTHSTRQFSAFYAHFQGSSNQMTSLPGHFRSPEVTWRHFLCRDCLLLQASLVESQMHTIRQFSAFYSHFQVNSGQMTSLPVTWGHVTSFPVTWLPAAASYSLVGIQTQSIRQFSPCAATSRWLSVKWRHFRATSAHLKSRDVISCQVTAFSCELQPCKKSNASILHFLAFYSNFPATSGEMTSLPGHFRSLEVKWRDFLSCDCLLVRATAF